MVKNELLDIKEVTETDNYERVNKLLEDGWVLISTHLNDYGHPVERHQKTIYCLGLKYYSEGLK